MDKSIEEAVRRVQDLLGAHTEKTDQTISETARGLVTVTVDAHLQLTSVKLHDKSLDEARRAALECSIVEAVNAARIKAVKAAGESLSALRESAEWKSAMDQLFRRGGAAA